MNTDNSIIILAACRGNETLPLNPQYPADIFTACLTTPVVTAIRWLIIQVHNCIENFYFDYIASYFFHTLYLLF